VEQAPSRQELQQSPPVFRRLHNDRNFLGPPSDEVLARTSDA
jgi:hypothetical protein